jgi:hypothetical protein
MVEVDDLVEPRRNRSFSPVSRRSFGRTAIPAPDQLGTANHDLRFEGIHKTKFARKLGCELHNPAKFGSAKPHYRPAGATGPTTASAARANVCLDNPVRGEERFALGASANARLDNAGRLTRMPTAPALGSSFSEFRL